jgi:hypothetical protein
MGGRTADRVLDAILGAIPVPDTAGGTGGPSHSA